MSFQDKNNNIHGNPYARLLWQQEHDRLAYLFRRLLPAGRPPSAGTRYRDQKTLAYLLTQHCVLSRVKAPTAPPVSARTFIAPVIHAAPE